MRTHVAIIALFTTGWAAAPADVDAEARAQRVGLRVCEVLDRQAVAEILDGYLPELRFVESSETSDTPWLAELLRRPDGRVDPDEHGQRASGTQLADAGRRHRRARTDSPLTSWATRFAA